jgi:hypothetical protein
MPQAQTPQLQEENLGGSQEGGGQIAKTEKENVQFGWLYQEIETQAEEVESQAFETSFPW